MKKYALLLVVFVLYSCGSKYYLKRAQKFDDKRKRAIEKAIAKGAKVSTDTFYTSLKIAPPPIVNRFETKIVSGKTEVITFKEKGIELNLRFMRTDKDMTVMPDIIVHPPAMNITAPIRSETKYECNCKWNFWHVLLGGVIGIGLTFGFFTIRKFIPL